MKVLDQFAGYSVMSGSVFIHSSYFILSLILWFTIPVNYANPDFQWLIGVWVIMHGILIVISFIQKEVLQNHKAWNFVLILSTILCYQFLIFYTLIKYNDYSMKDTVNQLFYVEDIYHFWIFVEISSYYANFVICIIWLFTLSMADRKESRTEFLQTLAQS